MRLDGKTALVTGGAVRVGRAICIALAARGCKVIVHYHRSSRQAEALAARLRAAGKESAAVGGNLDSPEGCSGVMDRALRIEGRLDVLVNNAAVFHKKRLLDASQDEILHEFNVNLLAPLWMTREFARRCGKGRVVNLLDRRIASNEAGMIPYLLSKKALADLTALAALELAPRIAVNGVAPGPVLGPSARAPVREKAGFIPLGKRPSPADVAAAVLMLIESDAITGQILFVDGGQHLM